MTFCVLDKTELAVEALRLLGGTDLSHLPHDGQLATARDTQRGWLLTPDLTAEECEAVGAVSIGASRSCSYTPKSQDPGKLASELAGYVGRRRREAALPFAIPAELRPYITLPRDLPRRVRVGPLESDDWTPFCVFKNPVVDFAQAQVQVGPTFDDLVAEFGADTPLPEAEVRVTQYASKHYKELVATQVEGKMKTYLNFYPETGYGILLPPPGIEIDGKINKTGLDFLAYGTPLCDKFIRTLSHRRAQRAETATELRHAVWMSQDFSVWPESTLEVSDTPTYRVQLTELERRLWGAFCEDVRVYLDLVENKMLTTFEKEPDKYSMSYKSLKSPGTDVVGPDGNLFDKREHWFYPHPAFDTGHPDKNGYAKFTFLPLKQELEALIVPRVKLRLEGCKKGKIGDPAFEFECVLKGASRDSVVAYRTNNPDECSRVVAVDKSKPIWSVKTEPITAADQLPAVGDDRGWRMIQGKAREHLSHRSPERFKLAYIHPYQLSEVYSELEEQFWRQTKGVVNRKDGKIWRRHRFTRNQPWLRARAIYPCRWTMNMFDGTVAKFIAFPIEESPVGFPVLKPSSSYFQHYTRELQSAGAVVPWALDVSHFETFCASNKWFTECFGAPGSPRKLYFDDAGTGWIASRFGRRYHGFQTSSGIGHTSMHSLLFGLFLSSVDIAYRGNPGEEEKVARAAWRCILGNAIVHAELGELPQGWSLTHPRYRIGEKEVTSLNGAGSDDQGGWDTSHQATSEEIAQALKNPRVTEWRERCHMSADIGEGNNFGIIRKPYGIERDRSGADWKWSLAEHKTVGDLLALGICVAFDTTPGLEEDIQFALDAIGAGSTKSYRLGAACARLVLENSERFCAELFAGRDPEYSPSARRMSEKLEESGFEIGRSERLKRETTREIIKTYLEFVGKEHLYGKAV